MTFLRKLSDIVFPKRYPSAWARQEMEHQNRWREYREIILEEYGRSFANAIRTRRIV